MKKITSTVLAVAMLILTATSCQKSQDATPSVNSEETSNAMPPPNSATLTAGVNAMLHGLQGYTGTNYNNFPSFQATLWTYLGTPAPRRSLLKFYFTGLNPNCTSASLVSAKLYLRQFDEINNTGNYYSIQQANNTAEIRRVTSNWNPSNVKWLNQPTTAPGLPPAPALPVPANAVAVPAIATPFSGSQDNPVIDVTDMVKQMLAGGAPYTSNKGFEIILSNETQPYQGRTYGSFASPAVYKPVLKLNW